MTWIAVAIAGSTVVGSLISANASENAADTQAQSAHDANQVQWDMFNRNKADLAPFVQGGQQGFNSLRDYIGVGPNGFDPNAPGVRPFGMADYQADPGYAFRLKQGENWILNHRSAIGGVFSGGTLKDLTNYGQGMASQEYGNAYNRYVSNQQNVYNRLAGLANTGVNAAGTTAGLGANAANQIGANTIGAGNAQAAGIVGSANAINNGIGSLSNNWLLANALQQGGTQGGMTQNQMFNNSMSDLNAQAFLGG